jgi:hypothetical protein
MVCEASGDTHDLGSQRPELQPDAFIADSTVGVEDPEGRGDGYDVGTAHPRSALTANSMVLIACSPWVPPAALINPITSSCRYGGSRGPSACSQSSAFLKAPEMVPWYIGLLQSIPSAP